MKKVLQSLRRWWPGRRHALGEEPPASPIQEVLEGQSSLSRALGRLLVRLESVEGQTRGDLAALRSELTDLLRPPPLDDLFSLADALKDLEAQLEPAPLLVFAGRELEAMTIAQLAASISAPPPPPASVSAGPQGRAQALRRSLALCRDRLDRFFAARGIARIGRVGEPVDGRALRVAEVVERDDLPDAAVAGVIRSGFVRGEEVLREGDVVVNRRGATGTLEGGSNGDRLGH